MAIRTIQDAVDIINSGSFTSDFDSAVDYLLTNDRNNPALDFLNDGTKDDEKLNRVTAYFKKAETLDNIDYQEFAAATMVWRNIKKSEFSFDQIHGTTLDDNTIFSNTATIQSIVNDDAFEDEVLNDSELKMAQNLTTYVDDDGNVVPATGGDFSAEDAEYARLESSKQRAVLAHSVDKDFMARPEDERRKVLLNTIKTDMYTSWLTEVGASAVSPEDDRATAAQNFNDAIEAAIAGRPVTVKTDSVLNGTIRTLESMRIRHQALLKAKCKKSALQMNRLYHKFGHFVGDYFGTKAELKLAGIYLMKHGKKRFVTNAAAAVLGLGAGGIAVASGSLGLAIAAAASYSVYSAASNAIFTVWERQNAEKRAAKEAGKDTKSWNGIAGFKKAYAKIKSNKKEYADYKRRNKVLAGYGLAGAGAALAIGAAASSAAAAGATYGIARFVAGTARVLGFNTNAILDAKQAKNAYKADKTNTKNKHEYHRRIGAVVLTLLSSSAAELAMAAGLDGPHHDAAHTAGQNAHQQVAEQQDTLTTQQTDSIPAQRVVEQTNSVPAQQNVQQNFSETTNTAAQGAAEIKVPTEWNENMGISKQHWDLMMARFAKSNITFDEAYTNVVKAQQANPDLFKDINPVKVVDEYFLKDSWVQNWEKVGVFDSQDAIVSKLHLNPNANVVDVTDFNNVAEAKGAIYHNQITVTDAEGNKQTLDFYSTDLNQLHKHDTMFRLERIIECGEKIEVNTQDANAMILAARVAGDRNVGVASFGGCGEDDTYTHAYIKKHATELHKPTITKDNVNVGETAEQVSQGANAANVGETTEQVTIERPAPKPAPELTASVKVIKTSTDGGNFDDPAILNNATVVAQGDLGAEAAQRIKNNAQEQSLGVPDTTKIVIAAKAIKTK